MMRKFIVTNHHHRDLEEWCSNNADGDWRIEMGFIKGKVGMVLSNRMTILLALDEDAIAFRAVFP